MFFVVGVVGFVIGIGYDDDMCVDFYCCVDVGVNFQDFFVDFMVGNVWKCDQWVQFVIGVEIVVVEFDMVYVDVYFVVVQ